MKFDKFPWRLRSNTEVLLKDYIIPGCLIALAISATINVCKEFLF